MGLRKKRKHNRFFCFFLRPVVSYQNISNVESCFSIHWISFVNVTNVFIVWYFDGSKLPVWCSVQTTVCMLFVASSWKTAKVLMSLSTDCIATWPFLLQIHVGGGLFLAVPSRGAKWGKNVIHFKLDLHLLIFSVTGFG